MTALSAVYAFYTQKSFVAKWLLFLASIPIAVAGNIGRIISIALARSQRVSSLVRGFTMTGPVMYFLPAISLMIGFGKVLQINYMEFFRDGKFI